MRGTRTRSSARRVLRAAPFAALLVVSLFSFFTPARDLPVSVDIWDKLGHAGMFAGLAVTWRFAGASARVALAGLLCYGAAVEVLQASLPIRRNGDWHDVVADGVGVLAGLLVVALVVALARGPSAGLRGHLLRPRRAAAGRTGTPRGPRPG